MIEMGSLIQYSYNLASSEITALQHNTKQLHVL